jgi:hypothetical protein
MTPEDAKSLLHGARNLLEVCASVCEHDPASGHPEAHTPLPMEAITHLLVGGVSESSDGNGIKEIAPRPTLMNTEEGQPDWDRVRIYKALNERDMDKALTRDVVATNTKEMKLKDLDELDFGDGKEVVETVVLGHALHPQSKLRMGLDIFGLILIAHDCMVIPFTLAFCWDDPDNFNWVFWTILLFWQSDMAFSAITGYYRRGALVMSIPMCSKHYAKTWFMIDLIVVGCDWVSLIMGSQFEEAGLVRVGRTFRILRSVRLLRLTKLKRLIEHVRDQFDSDIFDTVVDVMKSVLVILFLNHIFACIWYSVGLKEIDDYAGSYPMDMEMTWLQTKSRDFKAVDAVTGEPLASRTYKYLTSLHWSLTQFTPAAMEVAPTNVYERIVAVVALIFALIVFGSFISQLTACVTKLRALTADQERQFSLMRRYLRESLVPEQLKVRIRKFLEYKVGTSSTKVKESDVRLLKVLSAPLTMELQYYKLRTQLCSLPLFQILDTECNTAVRHICNAAVHMTDIGPGDNIFTAGQQVSNLQIITKGSVKYTVLTAELSEDTRSLKPGECLGEMALFIPWVYRGTAHAQASVELLTLNIEHFLKCVQLFEYATFVVRDYGNCCISMAQSTPGSIVMFGDIVDHIDMAVLSSKVYAYEHMKKRVSDDSDGDGDSELLSKLRSRFADMWSMGAHELEMRKRERQSVAYVTEARERRSGGKDPWTADTGEKTKKVLKMGMGKTKRQMTAQV